MNAAAKGHRQPPQGHPTPRQLALVHLAKERLGLEDEEYRDLLQSVAGVRSAAHLDEEGVSNLLRRFSQLGFRPRKTMRPARPGMATESQIAYIRNLWRRYAGSAEPSGLRSWLRKRFGIAGPRQLTREMAHQTLVALKDMTSRGKRGN